MPGILEAGIHEGLLPNNRLTAHAVLTGIIYRDCPALSVAPEERTRSARGLRERQIDGDLF